MTVSTLTVSPALNESAALPRSYSSPSISGLIHRNFRRPAVPSPNDLPRPASFTSLPAQDQPYLVEDERVAVDVLPEPQQAKILDGRDGKTGSWSTKEEPPKPERLGRRMSLVARPKSWIQNLKGGSPERQQRFEPVFTTPSDAPPVPAITKSFRDNKTKTASGPFATFARKSWMSSRSPSPNRNTQEADSDKKRGSVSKATGSPMKVSSRPVDPNLNLEKPLTAASIDSPPKLRSKSSFIKTTQRPASVLLNLASLASTNSSTSSLPGSSIDNRSTPRTSTDKVPPLPKNISTDKLNIGIDTTPRRRDELWAAFRSLEHDFSKFQSKSWSLKTNIVRSALLPFLRNYAAHPSSKNLRPEDLDRRVAILNKWWTGLLEVLEGRQNQTVSGVDRPILLEACYAIMIRPEWRLAPSHFAPLADRPLSQSPERRSQPSKKSSSASLSSSASQFLAESVYHNTRNLFVQNLLSQIIFVVNKMSLRHAPASLVTFCGKAAAFAFFFVPGIAEMLVRIWKLEADTLRRISDGLGMPRRVNKMELDDINAAFPSHIKSLGWTSVKTMVAQLRQNPAVPIMASKIQWHGPWAARWCGRDSDLFFVFVKHYHVLVEEFLPLDLSLAEKARAPGFMLVQAQVLKALDATIHRQPAADPLPITFDDVLAGADASAAALPLPSNNSARLMAENRLIMLLRDFISERQSSYHAARKTFAEAFATVMKASAGRTSLFDHNACFVLLDFAEEALAIYLRFFNSHSLDSDYIDWPFWMAVGKKMLESENSMSEIRLFAFLYGSWHLITAEERRKEILCLEWLLTEETFGKYFNHWSPMVRAYFMRLVCWRLCRDDGESSDLDTKIFSTVLVRVKSIWACYLFLKQSAEKAHVLPPSIVPCHPAPGRRLLIMRNDNQLPAANLFLSFDGLVNPPLLGPSSDPKSTSPKRPSQPAVTRPSCPDTDATPQNLDDPPPAAPLKKRWTFLGKSLVAPFTAPGTTTGPPVKTQTLEDARLQTALSRSRPTMHTQNSSTDSGTPPTTSTHRAFSFKFSLEWAHHFEKPAMAPPPSHAPPHLRNTAPERRLNPPRLPAPAHALVSAKVPGMSDEVLVRDPGAGEKGRRAQYAGRALGEWGAVVGECNGFVERRRSEGVPGLKLVEVPLLGVEGFRRYG
ncbi:unnamed protein product [Diplocarpon coronariae]|uniref:DUF1765-domain-containing protein n=1 Tax=Diplocarpon coronariae TaxID=2795749 RepID=A0A218YVT9_9HELO|nr:hypothetical protein B2J93_8787 [Marssonina coronariae]